MRNTDEVGVSAAPLGHSRQPSPARRNTANGNKSAVHTLSDEAVRAIEIDDILTACYPNAACALIHNGPYQLLVATVLSAQTTDARVNTITPELFAQYPTPADLAAARLEELEDLVRPLGMQHSRATRLIALGDALCQHYGGQVPADGPALESLPGVGRKTANVVLGNAFGIGAITVDTHVGRLSRRLGWTSATTPLAAEKDIAALLPQDRWTDACHRLIEHGRAICRARSPQCQRCALTALCPKIGVE